MAEREVTHPAKAVEQNILLTGKIMQFLISTCHILRTAGTRHHKTKGECMTREEILQFVNTNQVCYLATTEGSQPHVRGMMMYKADASGLIFHTGAFKSLFRQLSNNQQVEVCFTTKDMQLRIMGVVEFLDDLSLKQEIVEARPFLKPLTDARGYEVLIVFRVKDCKASVWTFATNLEPTVHTPI